LRLDHRLALRLDVLGLRRLLGQADLCLRLIDRVLGR
jgi:hypothetical protein